MAPDHFSNYQPLEVRVTEEVTKEGSIVPTRPVYEPGQLLDFIKGSRNRITFQGLIDFFSGNKVLAYAAFSDLLPFGDPDAPGLIEPTEEFQEGSDGKFSRVYRLTKLGEEVDYASLRPRTNITYISLPKTLGVLNRALEMDGDFEEMIGRVLESLGPKERQEVKQELQRLRFPTYNSQ